MKKTYRVLIVEDDATLAKVSIHHLEKYNFSVDWAENGKIALEKIQNQAYDLVLTDVMMPEMDGITFIEKAQPLLKKTPVILITSTGERNLIKKAQAYQASAYLLKPILPPKLLENVMQTLQLEPSDLIEKKNFPFSLESELSKNTLKMKIKGCTDRDFWDSWSQTFEGKNIKNIELTLEEEFAYSKDAYLNLDKYIKQTSEKFHISPESIKISGNFTKTMPKKEWSKFPFLGKCKIA